MGASKNHKQTYLNENPWCAFCGGQTKATTIEHCPPRAMFQNRHWPEGFEFPSCDRCNHESSDHDLLVALLARLSRDGDSDGKLHGLMMLANKQYPGLLKKMIPSPVEARRLNRQYGRQLTQGQTHQEAGAIKLPDEINSAVAMLASKLSKGIFYNESRTIFPDDGCLCLIWFTNSEYLEKGKYVVLDLLKNLNGRAPELKRSGKFLNSQFEYKLSLSPDNGFFIIQVMFGAGFGFVVFGSSLPDYLESHITELRRASGKYGPFTVLQSKSLKFM